jgi:5'-3' exonuclease
MEVSLVDGTYELFRQHFGRPEPGPYGATVGVLSSVLMMLNDGVTHIGVASDTVIESFRNELYAGYKTSAGMPEELLFQIPMFERAVAAMGVTLWSMVQWEADDAMAAAAAVASDDARVTRVLICTPDKDLGQCVGGKVFQFDRRKNEIYDADGVRERFGVLPETIPDYLGLVGDTADGFPGLPGWGAKSAAAVLARYVHLEQIPPSAGQWDVPGLRGAAKLSATLQDNLADAYLFRQIATVERDVPVGTVDDWQWTGPTTDFAALCEEIGSRSLPGRVEALAKKRQII